MTILLKKNSRQIVKSSQSLGVSKRKLNGILEFESILEISSIFVIYDKFPIVWCIICPILLVSSITHLS
jgi:hypothetical protein